MAGALHNVFWLGTLLAALSLLVSLYLPRKGSDAWNAPSAEMCSSETGERMIMSELATIDSQHEPLTANRD
jgi:hypothetical protein